MEIGYIQWMWGTLMLAGVFACVVTLGGIYDRLGKLLKKEM